MPLFSYAKVGTHSGERIRIKYKRKLPSIKQVIQFKRYPYGRYEKWETGLVYDIRETPNGTTLMVERW